ncbi:hypothetical protein L210DRAFT_840754, partial [Boletus edulis BED1]
FSIQCAVHRPNGSNAPLSISSTIRFDKLRELVAEKLGRFTGLVQLQYRLDSDKAKDGMISIQNDDEFAMFMDRLRPLIVPPRLANGKVSARRLKPVSVLFEDAGLGNEEQGNKGDSTQRGGTQAKHKTAAQSGSRLESKGVEEYISMLQARWTCSTHTKSPKAPVYCYSVTPSVCYPLTFANFNLWAFEIVSLSLNYIYTQAKSVSDAWQ